MYNLILKGLSAMKDPERALHSARFFKTGKGEYGEGDVFWGIVVPSLRSIARKYKDAPLESLEALITNRVHEVRLTALLVLTYKFPSLSDVGRKEVVDFYLKHAIYINNWDLVDLSAPRILGEWLADKDRSILYELVQSANPWKRRIAILATFAFIRNGDFKDALQISETLLRDEHDLIHKATGWMLREIGKKNRVVLEEFLDKYYKLMPRTMLRYAIERMAEDKRKTYMIK